MIRLGVFLLLLFGEEVLALKRVQCVIVRVHLFLVRCVVVQFRLFLVHYYLLLVLFFAQPLLLLLLLPVVLALNSALSLVFHSLLFDSSSSSSSFRFDPIPLLPLPPIPFLHSILRCHFPTPSFLPLFASSPPFSSSSPLPSRAFGFPPPRQEYTRPPASNPNSPPRSAFPGTSSSLFLID